MFEANVYLNHQSAAQIAKDRRDSSAPDSQVALHLYREARAKAWFNRLRSAVSGRRNQMLDLSALPGRQIGSRRYAGTQPVPIDRIRGSEGRSSDFDADFNPLQTKTRDRWVSIAIARQIRQPLPPVELIQVGDVYFVRDGHHRISVARALGQSAVDAEVTVWEVNGPLPWDEAPAGELALRPA